MEARFKVVMKKDVGVLKDFLSFTYRAQGTMGRMKLRVFAAGLVVIGYLTVKGGNTTAGIVIGVTGVVFLIMSLFLPWIAIWRLKKADLAYQNQTELMYVFTNGSMYIYENGELAQNVGSYNQVSCFYGDERNYYLGVNNEDLYLLPKVAFTEGDEKDFIEFIERKSNEKYEFLPITLKNKWMKFRFKMKQADAEHDAKAAELRRQAKEKKKRK